MKRHKWLLTLLLAVFLLGGGAFLLWQTGFFSSVGSLEEMRNYIERFAPYSHLFFFLIVLLTRPWGLLVACALGGSVLTIPVWAMLLLGAAGVAVFAVCLKYGDRWEAALLERFKR